MGINFSNHNLFEVKEHLSVMAEEVRTKIKKEVEGRVMSLMVDIGTKNKRSVLAISIQYNINGKLKIRSLGMIELKASHTGKYLADIIIERLKRFKIDKRQILTITTDNGKNVLKMIRDIDSSFPSLSAMGEQTIDAVSETLVNAMNQNENDRVENETERVDNEIENMLNDAHEVTEEEALEIWAQSVMEGEVLLQSVSETFSSGESQIWETTGVNCTAHTLQLAVKDSMKAITKNHQNVITLCRKIVKFLVLESTRFEVKERGMNYNLPKIDCKTRWGSTCIMVCYF